MFQIIYEIYKYGLIYAVPTALFLSIISIPEFKRELLFKYCLGYTATGLCIGYTYPISCPILVIYLLKDFEKEKQTRALIKDTLKKELHLKEFEIKEKLKLDMEYKKQKELNLLKEVAERQEKIRIEWDLKHEMKQKKRWF